MSQELGSGGGAPVGPATPARRRLRVRCRCDVADLSRPGEEARAPQPAWTHTVSATDVGLLLDRPAEPGAALGIGVRTAQGRCVPLLGRVVHATRGAEGRWLVGCRLSRPLTPDEADAIFEGAQPAPDGEAR
jgi:hypothetical protein